MNSDNYWLPKQEALQIRPTAQPALSPVEIATIRLKAEQERARKQAKALRIREAQLARGARTA